MSMSKKDYELIADVINKKETRGGIILGLSYAFERDNPRFDPVKFKEACYQGRVK